MSSGPYAISDWPHTIKRHRVTAGGTRDQTTLAFVPETVTTTNITGHFDPFTRSSSRDDLEHAVRHEAGRRVEGDDHLFTEDDVVTNDRIEVWFDAAGSKKRFFLVTSVTPHALAQKLMGIPRYECVLKLEEP